MRDDFFGGQAARLGYTFPAGFRRSFSSRPVLTTRLRVCVPARILNLEFLAPDDWVRADDPETTYNLPKGARGVVIASDGRATVYLAPRHETQVLEETLWLWPSTNDQPFSLAPNLAQLFKDARKAPPEKQLERDATRWLREASERAKAAKAALKEAKKSDKP